jgi:hypothetical protein
MDFKIIKWHETRNDNPDLHGYKVHLADYGYIMYYDKEQLREVYFLDRAPNYFMSCRVDFKTISHYYMESIKNPIRTTGYIRRYEHGKLDRTYLVKGPAVTMCTIGDTRRIYTATTDISNVNPEKLKADLEVFLDTFYELGLDKYFSPEEPKETKN